MKPISTQFLLMISFLLPSLFSTAQRWEQVGGAWEWSATIDVIAMHG